MNSRLLPLKILILNICLIVVAGLAGLAGMLLDGEWQIPAISIVAALLLPSILVTLHWLRLLLDIPAMLASDARFNLLTRLLAYLSGVFTFALCLGWLALAIWWIAAHHPGWAGLAWGYAIVAAPLLMVLLSPAGYPLLVLAVMVSQILYPFAWLILRFAWLSPQQVVYSVALLALLLPLIQFWRRWQLLARPD